MAQIETLAAGLTHASRAETSCLNLRGTITASSGGRVSNAWEIALMWGITIGNDG